AEGSADMAYKYVPLGSRGRRRKTKLKGRKCKTSKGFSNCMSRQLKGKKCHGSCKPKFRKAAKYCKKHC
ncbi:MAG: hypothetical protein PHI12_14610, partial [Dehalococcoidales bacterium]|nr:hypothetical protein [Dehalococcoidales bacterium]